MGHVLLLPSGSSRLIFTREGAHLIRVRKCQLFHHVLKFCPGGVSPGAPVPPTRKLTGWVKKFRTITDGEVKSQLFLK